MYLNLLFLACSLAVNAAQRIGDTGGYGLLRPGYNNGGFGGYNGGYNGYGQDGIGYQGYQGQYPGQYQGGYGGAYGGGYQGGNNYGYGQGYPGNYGGGYGGVQGGYGQGSGYQSGIGYKYPNRQQGYDYRPAFNYQGLNQGFQGYNNYNRPGYNNYNQLRPGFPGSQGNYFGGYGDGYNDNFRHLGRKVDDTKKVDTNDVKITK